MSASTGTWTGSPLFAYQWERCNSLGASCETIAGATSPGYTVLSADVGKTLAVTVTGSSSAGSASAQSAPTAVVSGAPANISAPTISGSAKVGEALSASPGSWSGSPAPEFGYQWERCNSLGASCETIAGATSPGYTVLSADVGKTLAVTVTGSSSAGSASAQSAPTAVVSGAPANISAPTISGSAKVGEALSASPGSWSGSPAPEFGYQWERCNSLGASCETIAGATSPGYTVLSADVGKTLAVTVTGSSSAGSASAQSAPTAVVSGAPANISAPTISGSAKVGEALSASPGSWSGSPAPEFGYQWERCNSLGASCETIAGATSPGYTVLSADVGKTLAVTVTGSSSAGSASAQSAPTAVVSGAPANISAPTISGSAKVGEALSASPGSWSGSPAPEFGYQWERCNSLGASCETIAGATSPGYTVLSADVGKTLAVTVTGSSSAGSASAQSAPTAVVSGAPANISAPTISGSAKVGEALSASPGSWSGSPAPEFGYQWERCNSLGASCETIAGATSPGYTVLSADVGKTLAVTVTGSSSAGSASAQSAPTAVVSGAPANISAPTISGSAGEGEALSASPGSWSGSPAPEFGYQWERCNSLGASCETIAGATSPGYTVLSADVGKTLAVTVTGSSSAGSASAQSAPTAVAVSAAGPLTPLLDDFARPNNSRTTRDELDAHDRVEHQSHQRLLHHQPPGHGPPKQQRRLLESTGIRPQQRGLGNRGREAERRPGSRGIGTPLPEPRSGHRERLSGVLHLPVRPAGSIQDHPPHQWDYQYDAGEQRRAHSQSR